MKILITGVHGQVGWELLKLARHKDLDVHGYDIEKLDITDQKAVSSTVENIAPDVVINAAAYTAADKAEQEVDLAYAVNRDGPANLALACREAGIPLLHISTDYIFDGSHRDAYTEEQPTSPLGVYGESKWQGEQAVREQLEQHIILRTSWVFGSHGHNFVKTMLRLGQERDELRVVDDQRGCPTAAADIAATLLEIATQIRGPETRNWGTYHFCNAESTSWFGFAKAIFDEAEKLNLFKSPALIPITTAEYPPPAIRPENSVLDCTKIAQTFTIKPRPWRQAFHETLLEMRHD